MVTMLGYAAVFYLAWALTKFVLNIFKTAIRMRRLHVRRRHVWALRNAFMEGREIFELDASLQMALDNCVSPLRPDSEHLEFLEKTFGALREDVERAAAMYEDLVAPDSFLEKGPTERVVWEALSRQMDRLGDAVGASADSVAGAKDHVEELASEVVAIRTAIKAYCIPLIEEHSAVDLSETFWLLLFNDSVEMLEIDYPMLEGDDWKGTPDTTRIMLRERLEQTPWGTVRYGIDEGAEFGVLAVDHKHLDDQVAHLEGRE